MDCWEEPIETVVLASNFCLVKWGGVHSIALCGSTSLLLKSRPEDIYLLSFFLSHWQS